MLSRLFLIEFKLVFRENEAMYVLAITDAVMQRWNYVPAPYWSLSVRITDQRNLAHV